MRADQSQSSTAIGTRGLELGSLPPPEGEMLPRQLSVGLDIDDRSMKQTILNRVVTRRLPCSSGELPHAVTKEV